MRARARACASHVGLNAGVEMMGLVDMCSPGVGTAWTARAVTDAAPQTRRPLTTPPLSTKTPPWPVSTRKHAWLKSSGRMSWIYFGRRVVLVLDCCDYRRDCHCAARDSRAAARTRRRQWRPGCPHHLGPALSGPLCPGQVRPLTTLDYPTDWRACFNQALDPLVGRENWPALRLLTTHLLDSV